MTDAVTLIETGMVNALKAGFALPPLAAQRAAVESYGGQLDDELFDWVRTLPAIWVTFDHAKGKRLTKSVTRYHGTFYVMAAQRVVGPEPSRRMGNGIEMGTYALLDAAKDLLSGLTLGLPIDALQPGDIKPVLQGRFNNQALSIFSQAWTTSWKDKAVDREAQAASDLTAVGLSYFLKPGDDVRDAADEVTLSD